MRAALLTAIIDPPPAYGRILRDDRGDVERIVEDRDCDAAQRAITEVNIAVYCFRAQLLLQTLGQLSTDNAQGELYLTDSVELLRASGQRVIAVCTDKLEETFGVNDLQGLAQVDRLLRQRAAAASSSTT